MLHTLARRVPSALVTLVVASALVFLVIHLIPGDPALFLAGPDPAPGTVDAIRADLGLDQPLPVQYIHWIGGLLTGDLGTSYIVQRPISTLITASVESTVELAFAATLLMAVIGLVVGVIGGATRSRSLRGVVDGLNVVLLSLPAYVSAVILIVVFTLALPVLPVSGEVGVLQDPVIGVQYLVLPAVALALPQSGIVARLVQTSMLQEREDDYVVTALAKGCTPRRVAVRHVLPNSVGAAIVVVGLRFGEILGGAIVVEALFARNGLGQLIVQSVLSRDYLVVQDLLLLAITTAIAGQLLSEVVQGMVDPRVRLGS